MNFSSKEQFPQLLCCNVCFYPPYKPRITKCQKNMLFCFKCTINKKNTDECAAHSQTIEYWQLPETYRYMLENMQIKCGICKEYQFALRFKKHEIKCQKRIELLEGQQTMQQQIQVSLLQKIQRKPLIFSEIDLNQLSKSLYTCNMCFDQFDGIIIQSHFQVCSEQRVSCEIENCEWKGTRKNYTQHFKSCYWTQIGKSQTEINQLEQANIILSRNQVMNTSEALVMRKKAILLQSMNQYTESLDSTPQRISSGPSNQQQFVYSSPFV